MKAFLIAICLLTTTNATTPWENESSKTVKLTLKEQTQSSYDKKQAPNFPKRTVVYISLWPRKLHYVDEREEVIQVDSSIQLSWHDDRLATNSSSDHDHINEQSDDFDKSNCSLTTVDESTIWTPLLISPEQSLHRSQTPFFLAHMYALVDFDGNVQLTGYYNEEISCLLSMRYFPFDQQKCNFTVASRPDVHLRPTTNRKRMLAIFAPELVMNNYNFDCGSWKLFASPYIINRTLNDVVQRVEHYCDLCRNNSRSYVTFKFLATRKPAQFIFDWIVPPIVLGSTGVMTIFMGCDRGERHSFGATLVVTLTLMLASLRDHMAVAFDGYPILAHLYLGFTATTIAATLLASLPRFIARHLRQKLRAQKALITPAQVANQLAPQKKMAWSIDDVEERPQEQPIKRNWIRLCALVIARYGKEHNLDALLMGVFLTVQVGCVAWAVASWCARPVY